MNRKEWKYLCKSDRKIAFLYYNKASKFLKSKEFESLENCDKNAVVIHHLRDTEEQRKYNDEHYEMFGFELDDNGDEYFEYGKYVVFWTKEHHSEYHRCSEETKLLIAKTSKERWANNDYRERVIASSKKSWESNKAGRLAISNRFKGKHLSEEHKQKIRETKLGENNPMYGTHPSAETLEKRSKAISVAMTEDVRHRISIHMPDRHGENNPMYGKKPFMKGKHHSEEIRKKISDNTKAALSKQDTRDKLSEAGKKGGKVTSERSYQYKEYKEAGGTLKWNEFQKALKIQSFADIMKSII